MKRSLVALFALGITGCAHEAPSRTTAAQSCSIAQLNWPAAQSDYNKERTTETLDKLTQVIRTDRESFRADPSGAKIGGGLNELNATMGQGPFIAHSAHQAATRLRQLECAIQRGTFNGRTADADHLYGEILTEVDKELKLARAR
jgi:hypothetical protein